MNKLSLYDSCSCRSHFTLAKLQPRVQIEKIVDNKFRNVKTQTDEINVKEEQVGYLLTEIADLEQNYHKIFQELQETKNTVKISNENSRENKLKTQEEIVRLMEKNVELETSLSRTKMEFFDEKQKLLTQITELQMELMVRKEEESQKNLDLRNNKTLLEERLEHVITDLKHMQSQNEVLQTKIYKYKHRVRYLTKFMKNNIINEKQISTDEKEKEEKNIEKERSISSAPETVSVGNTENENIKKGTSGRTVPDIENIVLTELFFKPQQFNIDKFDTIYL